MKLSLYSVVVILTLFTFSRQYELGTQYTFDYETSVLLNEPQTPPLSSLKDVGFKLNFKVNVSPIWQNPSSGSEQILQLKIEAPNLSVKARQGPAPEGFVSKSSKAKELNKELPFFIYRKGGRVENVFFTIKEPLSWINIKKGIANLFQYRLKDGAEVEVDTSGECSVLYRMKGHQLVQKIKNSCTLPVEHVTTFNHSEKVLGAHVASQREATYELDPDDGTIKTCSSFEVHTLRPEMRKSSGVEVIGRQVLLLQDKTASNSKTYSGKSFADVVRTIGKQIKYSLITEGLPTIPDPKECIACKSLSELVQNFQKALSPSSLGSQSSAISFLRLLGKMRESDEKVIKEVLQNNKNKNILPQLLDIIAGAQTISAHKAAKSVINFSGNNIYLAERYLLSLSLSTHPLEFVIEDLFKLHKKGVVNDHRLAETLVLTIASMTKVFANHIKNANQAIIIDIRKSFLSDLENCSDDDCMLRFIRALKNLQSKQTIETLLTYAKGTNRKLAIYAMRAIQTMPHQFIDSQTCKKLEDILFELDTKHDSNVRAMAAEILLRWKPKISLLKDIFKFLLSKQDPKSKELNTIILGHIRDISEKNLQMEELVRRVLTENGLWNYNVLSQGGLSSAFSRHLARDSSFNATFNNMLEINGGILKRSNVDVLIDVEDERMRLLSFGMFAGGLSMFGGDDDSDSNEDAHAGIEISILGTQLRPFVFFRGQGELMQHVWAGTASERTSALQGTILLQDHNQIIPLQNGLNAELTLTGSVSYDFAGQVQISMWNQNAHSLVEVGASFVVQGQARVDNSFIQTMVEFNVGSQMQLDFLSDLETSPQIMMCLQMVQPAFDIIDTVRKFERIPGSNYVLRKYKRKSLSVPGKTYVMNRKNTVLCNEMFVN